MDNIKFIKRDINVSKILKQLKDNPQDWGSQKTVEGAQSLLDQGFPEVQAGVLQLVIGGVTDRSQYVGDTEMCIPTPAINRHSEVVKFMKRHIKKFSRCGFLSLPVGGEVGQHIDIAKFTVGDETVSVKAGDLIWFNNKLPHGTKNTGNEVRITFVFDVPHK